MITAIPMNDDSIASHFTKAESLLFIDGQGARISRHPNPARHTNCAGKQAMLDLLRAQGTTRVVVRNIGQQMLGKLLANQFIVEQTRCGRTTPAELATQVVALQPLTDATQGRQSLNHEAKAGTCGCGGKAGLHDQKSTPCCQHTDHAPGSLAHPHGGCCHHHKSSM